MSKECVWDMRSPHGGNVEDVALFQDQITVPVCENHLKEHRVVMALYAAGCDVEEVLSQDPQSRQEEFDKLVANGTINPNNVKQ